MPLTRWRIGNFDAILEMTLIPQIRLTLLLISEALESLSSSQNRFETLLRLELLKVDSQGIYRLQISKQHKYSRY